MSATAPILRLVSPNINSPTSRPNSNSTRIRIKPSVLIHNYNESINTLQFELNTALGILPAANIIQLQSQIIELQTARNQLIQQQYSTKNRLNNNNNNNNDTRITPTVVKTSRSSSSKLAKSSPATATATATATAAIVQFSTPITNRSSTVNRSTVNRSKSLNRLESNRDNINPNISTNNKSNSNNNTNNNPIDSILLSNRERKLALKAKRESALTAELIRLESQYGWNNNQLSILINLAKLNPLITIRKLSHLALSIKWNNQTELQSAIENKIKSKLNRNNNNNHNNNNNSAASQTLSLSLSQSQSIIKSNQLLDSHNKLSKSQSKSKSNSAAIPVAVAVAAPISSIAVRSRSLSAVRQKSATTAATATATATAISTSIQAPASLSSSSAAAAAAAAAVNESIKPIPTVTAAVVQPPVSTATATVTESTLVIPSIEIINPNQSIEFIESAVTVSESSTVHSANIHQLLSSQRQSQPQPQSESESESISIVSVPIAVTISTTPVVSIVAQELVTKQTLTTVHIDSAVPAVVDKENQKSIPTSIPIPTIASAIAAKITNTTTTTQKSPVVSVSVSASASASAPAPASAEKTSTQSAPKSTPITTTATTTATATATLSVTTALVPIPLIINNSSSTDIQLIRQSDLAAELKYQANRKQQQQQLIETKDTDNKSKQSNKLNQTTVISTPPSIELSPSASASTSISASASESTSVAVISTKPAPVIVVDDQQTGSESDSDSDADADAESSSPSPSPSLSTISTPLTVQIQIDSTLIGSKQDNKPTNNKTSIPTISASASSGTATVITTAVSTDNSHSQSGTNLPSLIVDYPASFSPGTTGIFNTPLTAPSSPFAATSTLRRRSSLFESIDRRLSLSSPTGIEALQNFRIDILELSKGFEVYKLPKSNSRFSELRKVEAKIIQLNYNNLDNNNQLISLNRPLTELESIDRIHSALYSNYSANIDLNIDLTDCEFIFTYQSKDKNKSVLYTSLLLDNSITFIPGQTSGEFIDNPIIAKLIKKKSLNTSRYQLLSCTLKNDIGSFGLINTVEDNYDRLQRIIAYISARKAQIQRKILKQQRLSIIEKSTIINSKSESVYPVLTEQV